VTGRSGEGAQEGQKAEDREHDENDGVPGHLILDVTASGECGPGSFFPRGGRSPMLVAASGVPTPPPTGGPYIRKGEKAMSVAKVIEISSSSKKGFEDAIRIGIETAAQTVDNIRGAWVNEQKVLVKKGKVSEYRVMMKVTFEVEEEPEK
jgi:flavin-binding protein dodecin